MLPGFLLRNGLPTRAYDGSVFFLPGRQNIAKQVCPPHPSSLHTRHVTSSTTDSYARTPSSKRASRLESNANLTITRRRCSSFHLLEGVLRQRFNAAANSSI